MAPHPEVAIAGFALAGAVGLRGAWLALVIVAVLVLIACHLIANVESER